MPAPKIDYEKCTVCGTCVNVCPVSVFEKASEKVEVKKPGDCIGCRACEVSCPVKAIKVED
jgi:NAD-dependent dihydropyrimidine dehydrogenase PreA subunit